MSGGRSSPAPASLPDNDDLLGEILVRLPPLPSSLPRASLVCKRWRRLLCDPAFLRRFRARHQKPPLLGFFAGSFNLPTFFPTLLPPDRIPPARFSAPQHLSGSWKFLGCRHGFVAFLNLTRLEAVVWEPVTGRQHRIPLPPLFHRQGRFYEGAVLSSASHSHSHGDRCHLMSAFKLVLVHLGSDYRVVSVCLYESESGKWGNISSTALPFVSLFYRPTIMVGNALYWLLHYSNLILEFDLDRQSLAVIQKPEGAHVTEDSRLPIVTHDNKLGLAILSKLSIQLWERKADSDGVVRWVLWTTVKLRKLLSPLMHIGAMHQSTLSGFDEDNHSIFLSAHIGVFMIQLESMQCTKLLEGRCVNPCYPYTSFYTSGNSLPLHCRSNKSTYFLSVAIEKKILCLVAEYSFNICKVISVWSFQAGQLMGCNFFILLLNYMKLVEKKNITVA